MHRTNRLIRQPWQMLGLFLISIAVAYAQDGLIESNNEQNPSSVIIVDGFVDTQACYAHLEAADANGNNDGKLQADEFVTFAQLQTPGGQLNDIPDYRSMPLAMQATFVTLTCLCRDKRFGGDPKDTNCCLGVDAHIAIVGNDSFSTSQEATRLFATCFLTDQAIQQVLGSEPPSAHPTKEPSVSPTKEPTPSPSQLPTAAPSAPPTNVPTAEPTTAAPTTPNPTVDGPTIAPTSAAPTTAAPTTAEPTEDPTLPPTTAAPTAAPPVVLTPTQAVYTIAIENGAVETIPPEEYEPDLLQAMDELATTVVEEVFATSKRRRRRSLQVLLQLPTSISKYERTNCTKSLVGPDDRCEMVEHIITLTDSQGLDPAQVQRFETAIMQAIFRGELQDNLPEDSIVTILTGMAIPILPTIVIPPTQPDVDEGLSSGATAGIVLAALAVTILPICFYLAMRNSHDEKEPYGAYEPHDADSADGLMPEDEDVEATSAKIIGRGTLGASPTNYGKSYEKEVPILQKLPPLSPEREGRDAADADSAISHDSSSAAGSSGWSSSAGLSSLNTGSRSADSSMDLLNSPQSLTQASSLAAIGAASAVARRMENRRNISPMTQDLEELNVPPGAVSRNDLDNAIEAGDWAAVGATAALLAAASDSQSASSKSKNSRSNKSSEVSSVDAQRAAELDHLVDAGDWEGVVLAAAKFEAQEGSVRSGTASSARSSSVGSDPMSGTGSGTFTPSVSTSVSETASKAQKRAQLRQEVEALVRRVVPEELDNVDEMMAQFKGREEELVETLRTMQERAVAQKSRTAGHKAAKLEARRTVQRGGLPTTLPPPTEAEAPPTAASGPGQDAPPPGRVGQASSAAAPAGKDGSQHRTALEQAIEAGDWEAVGEAAALMSDVSMASASTAEFERLAAGARLGQAGGGASSSHSLRTAGVNANRARELDEMIDRGDWAAVVQAAGRFNQADKEASSHSTASTGKRASKSTGSDAATKRSKEEEDALAQAEIWMQIANQSKVEGATDTGASDAADWAIARSLKSLKKAEGDGSSASGSGSNPSAADDDESV